MTSAKISARGETAVLMAPACQARRGRYGHLGCKLRAGHAGDHVLRAVGEGCADLIHAHPNSGHPTRPCGKRPLFLDRDGTPVCRHHAQLRIARRKGAPVRKVRAPQIERIYTVRVGLTAAAEAALLAHVGGERLRSVRAQRAAISKLLSGLLGADIEGIVSEHGARE